MNQKIVDTSNVRRQIVTWVLGCAVQLAVGANARGDGLIQSLPSDGSFVRYNTVVEQWRDGGVFSRDEGTLTISSVGTADEVDVHCRWIEFRLELHAADSNQGSVEIRKYLLPEIALTGREAPLEVVVRSWCRSANGEVRADEVHPWFTEDLWLPGPLEERKESEEPVTLRLASRSLTLKQVITGRSRWEGMVGARVLPTETMHKLWTDESVPFGVARAHLQFKFKIQNLERVFKYDLELETSGTGAKSALPENW